jgi:hypothetical protein
MRKYLSVAFVAAFALLISTTAVSAFAQDMPEGFDPGSFTMPDEISGTYSNSDAGVTITFPDGWSGIAMEFGGAVFASVTPGGMTGEEEPKKMIALVIANKTEVDEAPTDPGAFSDSETEQECSDPVVGETTVSGKRAYEITVECTVDGESNKMKITAAESADNWVGVMYMSPVAEYDADVGKYDAAVDSLQIEGAVDASIPEMPTGGSTGGTDGGNTTDDGSDSESNDMPVMVAGEEVNVAVESTSTISEFELDEATKTLSFKADGAGDSTSLSVGAVLAGPYTVMVDGAATEDFEESTDANGVTTISVPHASGAHDVTITGTQVVPEFPIAMLGIVAAVIAVITVAGRARLVKAKF